MSENIVLSEFTRIGDRVIMDMSPDTRGWSSRKYAEDGTRGTVIGYTGYVSYEGYNEPYYKPGKYHRWGQPVILWDGSLDPCPVDAMHLSFEDRALKELRMKDPANATVKASIYLSELPDVGYMPGDVVRVNRYHWDSENGDHVRIKRINYHHLYEKRDNGSPMPIFDAGYAYADSGYTFYGLSDIVELIERGNYYHWFKGNKADLKFKDLRNEADFYYSIGMVKEVRNEKTRRYTWSLEAALEALINNEADMLMMSPSMFMGKPALRVSRVVDHPDLAERLRTETRMGFAVEIQELLQKKALRSSVDAE